MTWPGWDKPAQIDVALRISPGAARGWWLRRVAAAVELAGDLPGTLAELRDGLIDEAEPW